MPTDVTNFECAVCGRTDRWRFVIFNHVGVFHRLTGAAIDEAIRELTVAPTEDPTPAPSAASEAVAISPLIPCPDCGTQISRLAVACPKCGRPAAVAPATSPQIPHQQPMATNPYRRLIGLGVLFVAAVLSMVLSDKKPPEQPQQKNRVLSTGDRARCERLKTDLIVHGVIAERDYKGMEYEAKRAMRDVKAKMEALGCPQ